MPEPKLKEIRATEKQQQTIWDRKRVLKQNYQQLSLGILQKMFYEWNSPWELLEKEGKIAVILLLQASLLLLEDDSFLLHVSFQIHESHPFEQYNAWKNNCDSFSKKKKRYPTKEKDMMKKEAKTSRLRDDLRNKNKEHRT